MGFDINAVKLLLAAHRMGVSGTDFTGVMFKTLGSRSAPVWAALPQPADGSPLSEKAISTTHPQPSLRNRAKFAPISRP